MPRRVPGTSREITGGPRGLPGSPGACPGSRLDSRGHPLGAVWAPFWVPFLFTFSSEFRDAFFNDFGTHSGSISAPFWDPKSTSGALGHEKVDLRKALIYLIKSILFEPEGSPGLPKSLPEATSKFDAIFCKFLLPK